MMPLTVTWAPFKYTDIGYKNFKCFIDSGFDNILVTPNGEMHRRLSKLSFLSVGDAWQPFSYGQMSIAFHIALRDKIKLIFFGENGEAEYGGATHNFFRPQNPLDDWNNLYFKGASIDRLLKQGIETGYFSENDVKQNFHMYYPPNEPELLEGGYEYHWYSYYHKWVPQENYYYCKEHTGFEANPNGRSEGTYSKYASLDDRMDGFHYYLGFVKFGLGRCTSDAAHEVRDGHITREEAVALVKRYDGEFPAKHFQEFLEYIDITEEQFWQVCDSWRQPHLWEKDRNDWRLRHAVYFPEHAVEPL